MPELPETETIARDLDAAIGAAVIDQVRVVHADVMREVSTRAFAKRVIGTTIIRCWRRAKLVVIDLSNGDRIVVQPRFTGALLIDDGHLDAAERRYSAVAFHFGDGRTLHYRDIRRLGTVTLMTPARFSEYVSTIGPEPLDSAFTVEHLSARIRRSRQAIKKVLMDQKAIAGVGNIYANEGLWRAGIDPSRSAATLTADETARLHEAIVSVLSESIDARGTSFRDYRDASGQRGRFAARLDAYGRAGEPCHRCGHRLIGTHAIDGRMTVLCANCQS
jgi:formamidopyrimidine-DNA glycosylase